MAQAAACPGRGRPPRAVEHEPHRHLRLMTCQDGGFLYPRARLHGDGSRQGARHGYRLHELGCKRPPSGHSRRGAPKELAYNHINQMSFRVASVEDLQTVWRQRERRAGCLPTMRGWTMATPGRCISAIPKAIASKSSATRNGTSSSPALRISTYRCRRMKIRAKSDAFCRSAKGFRPIAEYQAEVAKKIARGRVRRADHDYARL